MATANSLPLVFDTDPCPSCEDGCMEYVEVAGRGFIECDTCGYQQHEAPLKEVE